MVASRVGQVALHAAAQGGCWRAASLLQEAAPGAAALRDRRDHTPAALAMRRGHKVAPPSFAPHGPSGQMRAIMHKNAITRQPLLQI